MSGRQSTVQGFTDGRKTCPARNKLEMELLNTLKLTINWPFCTKPKVLKVSDLSSKTNTSEIEKQVLTEVSKWQGIITALF